MHETHMPGGGNRVPAGRVRTAVSGGQGRRGRELVELAEGCVALAMLGVGAYGVVRVLASLISGLFAES